MACEAIQESSAFDSPSDISQRLNKSELILLGGRPGAGISMLATRLMLESALRQKRQVHIFSNQGNLDWYIDRLTWMAADLDSNRVPNGSLNVAKLSALRSATEALDRASICLHHNLFTQPELLPEHILQTIPPDHEGALFVIDFFQWHGRDHRAYEGRCSQSLAGLKQVAISLKASVLLLVNLKRSVEMRNDKRPLLSDLPLPYRQGNAVDQTWLIYRHSLYHKDESEAILKNRPIEAHCHSYRARDLQVIFLRHWR